jgi:hypothetical protein
VVYFVDDFKHKVMALGYFLKRRKYEVLLAGLLLHLFIGIFIQEPFLYSAIVWPVNMVILGLAGFGVFVQKAKWKMILRNVLFLPVMALPLGAHYFRQVPVYFLIISVVYCLFFVFIFWELMAFLIRPGYINVDIISAAACGYLLLVEISTFLFQLSFYQNQASFKGIDTSHHTTIYNDLAYFSCVTLTSIGFGDIIPAAHNTKLLTALVGIAGQFYSVVMVGIVISKFVSKSEVK